MQSRLFSLDEEKPKGKFFVIFESPDLEPTNMRLMALHRAGRKVFCWRNQQNGNYEIVEEK